MSGGQLYGLVLAGGHSRRMQRDKALLEYGGRSQLQRAFELLAPHVRASFVSVRADQREDPARAAHAQIVDLQPELGPIGGIQAALHAQPQVAWLVLACDLPFLSPATLQHLIDHRDAGRLATAYLSSHDGLPEPLCAIFEPAARDSLDRWIATGQRCPRAWLGQSDARLLPPPDSLALENINTPEQYASALAQLPHSATRRLHVRYFALLREQAGRADEELASAAGTPLELYAELRARRGLKLAPEALRVAINDEFGDWRTRLSEGDTVAFLPPVAGG
ncbi:MAG TPA: NTP transferase domain-containing protein [Steroidobacteraceae bacterium]|nr:NTP transferase domain-containing protein [Steroidobacteraceae bacterium]